MSYIKKIEKEKFFILFILLLSLSLFIGFYLNEDSTGGAYEDYIIHNRITENFFTDFKKTFLNFDQLKTRHSPIILIFFSTFKFLGINHDTIRFFNLFLVYVMIYFFYRALQLLYKQTDNKILLLFSFLLILSPTIRTLSIWPDSQFFGIFFFVISLFIFLNFQNCKKNKKLYFASLNILVLAICSYIRPSFSLFSVYFFWFYLKEFHLTKKLFFLFFLNLFLSLPAFYYLFILEVMFLKSSTINDLSFFTRFNPANKILIISSIVLFHALPFIYIKFRSISKKFMDLKLYENLIILLIFLFCVFFFNYEKNFTGGGIFFHFSNLFNSNIVFFIFAYIGLIFIYILSKFSITNLSIILILFLGNPQLTIYHKYYDPLLLILFLLLFVFNLNLNNHIKNKKYLLFFYIHSVLFLLMSINK